MSEQNAGLSEQHQSANDLSPKTLPKLAEVKGQSDPLITATQYPDLFHSQVPQKADRRLKEMGERLVKIDIPRISQVGSFLERNGTSLFTRETPFPGSETPRTGAVRRNRAKVLKKLQEMRLWAKNNPDIEHIIWEGRPEIHARNKAYDIVANQFINDQKEITVDLGSLGEQMSRFVVLRPPNTDNTKPPIFLIPGVSNDLEKAGSLPHELALQGRTVIVVSFPESWKGRVTREFVEATKKIAASDDFDPYTAYFKKVITQIQESADFRKEYGNHETIELVGFSTGANLVADILRDKDYQEKVTNAVLYNPGACIDRDWAYVSEAKPWPIAKALAATAFRNLTGKGERHPQKKQPTDVLFPIPGGVIKAALQDLLNLANLPFQSVSHPELIPVDKEQRKLQVEAYEELQKVVLLRREWWKKPMKVRGGKIVVISAGKDNIAVTSAVDDEIQEAATVINPQMTLVKRPKDYHQTALSEPWKVVQAANEALDA